MSDRRGSVFVDNRPVSRAPTQAPDAPPKPVTFGQIAGAQWTLGRQDFVGAPVDAEIEAYRPIVSELARNASGFRYVRFGAGGMPVDTDHVWADVAQRRATDPTFMKDVPANNAAEFSAWVHQQEANRRRAAQDIVGRQRGVAQNVFGFGASVATGLVDPINLAVMVLTGGGSASGSLFRGMAREALINGATEVAELPTLASNRAQFGEDMTVRDMLSDVALAGVGGAAFHGGLELLKGGARKLARLRSAPDRDVSSTFGDAVPPDVRTPEQQAALHVLGREADIEGSSPFQPSPAGLDAHAERLQAALASILAPEAETRLSAPTSAPASPATLPIAAPAAPRPDLSPDRVIRFVMHDLEGGAAVVRYGDVDGGTTKYGIAAKHNPGVDVANLTEGEAAAIARRKYWLPEYDRADPRAAAIAFDAGYIGGPDLGRRILHESGGNPARALELYREHLNHLADTIPAKAKYRKGWNARVDKLAAMVGASEDGVRLDPQRFAGDDDALAVAQRDLDHATMDAQLSASERARAGDPDGAPIEPMPAPEHGLMEASALVEAEPTPSQATPAAAAMATPRKPSITMPEAAPIDPEARAAVRRYISDTRGSLRPAKLGKALGIEEADARRILSSLVGERQSGLVVLPKSGEIRRRGARRAPVDLLRFLSDLGGIADDEGHDLRGRDAVRGGDGRKERGLQKFVPASGPLIRDTGMSIDRAREAAAEAGYFHDRSPDDAMAETTVADFIDLLRQAHGEPVYARADLERAAEREQDAALAAEIKRLTRNIDARLVEHGFDFDRGRLRRAAELVQRYDIEPDEAILRVVNEDLADVLDAGRIEAEKDRYELLADEIERTLAGDDRGGAFRDDGRGPDAGDAGEREAGADQFRGAGESGNGAHADQLEADHLSGPPPLDDPTLERFSDPDGEAARATADSLAHDLRGGMDAIDPAIAERQRQEAVLKAGSPLQAKADQEGTIGLGLFDATDQPEFRLDEEGGERDLKSILDEIDADEAAIRAARDCL